MEKIIRVVKRLTQGSASSYSTCLVPVDMLAFISSFIAEITKFKDIMYSKSYHYLYIANKKKAKMDEIDNYMYIYYRKSPISSQSFLVGVIPLEPMLITKAPCCLSLRNYCLGIFFASYIAFISVPWSFVNFVLKALGWV